jgi:hypothetical protein
MFDVTLVQLSVCFWYIKYCYAFFTCYLCYETDILELLLENFDKDMFKITF